VATPRAWPSEDLRAEGLDPETDEGKARYQALLAEHKIQTGAEGAKVRELGGLYVLGTERHDSRRIDNQLRGRSGRQGDPGESRFYLSLEDELMRLFATGAMNWVMGKALPDDVPIEAKMVTKAIERAQNTVEQRNAEIRKNVLKYDEVMNEQRKVIYKRRDQILLDADLRAETLDYLEEAIEAAVSTFCVNDIADEEWDLDGLHTEITTLWPTSSPGERAGGGRQHRELNERLLTEAVAYYETREQELGETQMRQIERQVMLNIIDQHWREHLLEMDYLEEGIGLRAMGQRDPLVEWQREGYEMFGVMMTSIAQDFVKYVMHVQVVKEEAPAPPPVRDLATSGPEDPSVAASGMAAAARAQAASEGGEAPAPAEPETMQPVVKSDWDKTPRNAPCPCGSGKKFKNCHGTA
jgi:preprotein translocase subunit SecA